VVVVQQQRASKGAGLVVGMSSYAKKFEHGLLGRVPKVPAEDDLFPRLPTDYNEAEKEPDVGGSPLLQQGEAGL
jgi:hypothetical protein